MNKYSLLLVAVSIISSGLFFYTSWIDDVNAQEEQSIETQLTREQISDLRERITDLRFDLQIYKAEEAKLKVDVQNAETHLKNMENLEKQAKNNHKLRPNEDNRVLYEEAKLNTLEAIQELANIEAEFAAKEKQVELTERDVEDLEEKLEDSEDFIQTLSSSRTSDKTKTIGIMLSKSCIIQLEQNMPTNCPGYDDIMELGLDTSRPESGEFFVDDNGVTKRGKPAMDNHFRLYDFDEEWNIIIDPDGNFAQRIKLVHIESNVGVFSIDTDIKVNNTRILHDGRYVDNCEDATIDASRWLELLADTIFYVRSGCGEEFTSFDSVITITDVLMEHDIRTTQKWQQENHTKWILQNCLQEYGKCS